MRFCSTRWTQWIAAVAACAALTACGGGGGSAGTQLLGSGSTQAQSWKVVLAGNSIAFNSVVSPCTVQGETLVCSVAGHNGTADPTSGAIIENYAVALVATVTNSSGYPVAGATVTFSMGSSTTGTTGVYCDTTTQPTTGQPSCTAGSATGVLKAIAYTPGFADGTGKVTTPITTTTGSDGKAYVYYYPGGASGTDVADAVVTSPTSSSTYIQAQASATMEVN